MTTVVAATTQEPVLEPAALEVVLELALDEGRQATSLAAQAFGKAWVVPLDELVEQRLLGSAAAVARAALGLDWNRGRHHASRPCDRAAERRR